MGGEGGEEGREVREQGRHPRAMMRAVCTPL